jgi:DNA-binding NarL/FixJ family response regulator
MNEAGGRPVIDPETIDPEMLALVTRMREAARRDPARQRDVVIGEFTVDGARVPLSLIAPLESLTRTEAAVLRFAGWGRSNADIATLLAMSEGTARTHLNSAVRKLDLDGMRALVAVAGLLFLPLD